MTKKTARSTDSLDTVRSELASALHPVERRDRRTREALRRRIQHEFAEMPGLSLTLTQASKLFGVAPDTCTRVLSELAQEGLARARVRAEGYPSAPRRES